MKQWRQLFIVLAILGVLYYFFSNLFGKIFEDISKGALNFYVNTSKMVGLSYSQYFAQADAIDALRKENKILNEQALTFNSQMKAMKQDVLFNNFEHNNSFSVVDASVLGYSALPNMFRVWLDIESNATNKTLGLIVPLPNKIDSVACGIAAYKPSGWEGYLNGDSKCAYSVFVGQNKAPGILNGKQNGSLVARFIPAWVEIKVGDEVVASGVDKLFFEGVKIGVVKEINNDNTFNEAIVEPYCNSLAPSRYYAISKND